MRWTWTLAAVLGGCGPSVEVDDGGTTGSASGSADVTGSPTTADGDDGAMPQPSTTMPGTSPTTMTMTSGEDESSGDFPSFVDPHGDFDRGPTTGCSIWERDCSPGLKCMPYANDGGSAWNDTICTPVARDPRAIGESCTAFEGPLAGIDDCDIHSMCWDVDEANEGTCIGFCIGSDSEPSCAEPDAHCSIAADGPLALCLPTCHPIDDPCAAGDVCIPSYDDAFFCVVDASEDGGAVLDECEFVNVCDPGLVCASAELVPGCASVGCCTPFCDIGDAMPCADGPPWSECLPWYEEGTAPPSYETLGVCGVPT